MGRKYKQKTYPLLEKLEITDIAAEGKGLGRADNFVVFVDKGIPGDVVQAKITQKNTVKRIRKAEKQKRAPLFRGGAMPK